jgi:tellurite resistance protein TerB
MPDKEIYPKTQHEIIDPSECAEQAIAALVTAGALVAIADRHVDAIEREAVIRFINDRRLVPTIAGPRIANLFDERARRLEQPDFANVTIEALRPVSALSLSADVIEIAERVAAVDRHMHSYELQAIKLIRLITMSLPRSKVMTSSRGSSSYGIIASDRES